MKNKAMVILGLFLGVILFVVGYVYATHTAGQLPSFFPGFSAGAANIHIKHSIAAFIVGIACFVFAWFQSGPKKTT